MRKLRQHAMDLSDLARHSATGVVFEGYPERGFNYRMTDMQAALGLCQLDALDGILAARTRLAERYNDGLRRRPVPRDALHARAHRSARGSPTPSASGPARPSAAPS